MMFLSTFFTESSPSTFLSSSNEMRFLPIVTYFFAQLYSRSTTLRPVKEIQKSVGSFKRKAALRHAATDDKNRTSKVNVRQARV
jgi:hypothetical protein